MEGNKIKKYKVKLNNNEKIEELLQETYDQACQQYKAIQDEINKIANSTIIKDLDIEGKEKYGKIMNNYITLQQKSIGQKFDIAKLLAEVVKHGGDVKGAIDTVKQMPTTLDINKLRQLAKDVTSNNDNKETYDIKK